MQLLAQLKPDMEGHHMHHLFVLQTMLFQAGISLGDPPIATYTAIGCITVLCLPAA